MADGWAVTIDLYDAYLRVPIHQDSPRLWGFSVFKSTFSFQVLPFDLKDVPGVFSPDVLTIPDWQVFRKWCDSSSCNPRSAFLDCIADIFMSFVFIL